MVSLFRSKRLVASHGRPKSNRCRPALELLEDRRLLSGFVDNFEGPTLNSFWTPYTQSGSVTFPSTARVHGGSQSLELDSTSTAQDKWINVHHDFATGAYGQFSVWMYDAGAGASSSNYMGLYLNNATQDAIIQTYDYGFGDGADYHYQTEAGSFDTGIQRSAGWHKLEIDTTPAGTNYLIDGTTVGTGAGIAVTTIRLMMFGPSWRPAWSTSFDDFQFSPLNSSDIAPTSLTLDTAQGGVDFSYKVSGAALTQDTTAALYWSSSDQFADAIGGPVYSTTIEHAVGDYGPFFVPNSVLGQPPAGATHLLLVTDPPDATHPNGLIDESDETNNVLTLATKAATATTLAVSASTPLAGVDPVTLTATVTVSAPASGTLTGSVDFYDTTTGQDLGSAALVGGVAALNTSPLTAGGHTLTATYSGDSNFLASAGAASLTALAPASLSGTVFADFNEDGQIDFGESGISGVSVHLAGTDDLGGTVDRTFQTDADGAYLFLNLRPGSYSLTRTTQPSGYTPGIDSVGTAGGSLSTTVADQFLVHLDQGVNGLNYNYGEQPAADGSIQKGQTAGIGFWNNKNGQALILALNGGSSSHELGDWLGATFTNLYGANSSTNLVGKSNAAVAALFQQDFLQKGVKVDAQVLATALSVYATNTTLDSTQVAASYGFTVSGYGVGTRTFNVGSNGDAFGVANNTTLTVLDLLLAADAQAVNGQLYAGNVTKRKEANDVFSAINGAGGIS